MGSQDLAHFNHVISGQFLLPESTEGIIPSFLRWRG